MDQAAPSRPHERRRSGTLQGVVLVLATLVVALVSAALLAVYARRGFDFTDEGYYLNLIAHPSQYRSTTTASLFHYVWHPVFAATGGNIAALRIINVTVTAVLAFALAWTASGRPVAALLIRREDPAASRVDVPLRVMMSVAAALASFGVFESWLLTPSYNSLTFQAIALTMLFCLLAMSRIGWRHDLALAGIAAGGWLCFLAKPTSAVLLGLVVASILLAPSRRSWRAAGIVAVSLVAWALVTLAAMGMTPAAFVDYYRESLTLTRTMGGHGLADMIAPDGLILEPGMDTALLWGALLLIVGCGAALHRLPSPLTSFVAVMSAISAAAVALVLYVGLEDISSLRRESFDIVYWLAVPAALIVLLTLAAPRLRRTLSRDGLVLLIVFFVLPLCATFGTNNNTWHAFCRVASFWVVAGIVFVVADHERRRALIPLFAITLALAVLTLALSIVNPYRQDSLLTARTKTAIGVDRATLEAGAASAARIAALRAFAGADAGPPQGFVDLTGESPGLIYAAGGRALGQGWILGAYPGSLDVAKLALRDIRCRDLRRAAVLVEPRGPRRIDPGVLASVGLDLRRDFEPAGVVPSKTGGIRVFLPRSTIRGAIHCQP